jgi:tetratricopeptide (TPR) repeat protein
LAARQIHGAPNTDATNQVASFYPPRVIVSFTIDDLKQSVPGAADLAALTGDELSDALRCLLGKAADGAVIRVDGKMISLDFGDIPPDQLQEADRLCEKASRQANKGELPKAASIYRRALELNPSLQIARRALAMALLESGKSDDAIDALLDALKTDPLDHEALVILGNHYARQDSQHEVALSLIRRACEVAPDDPVAHNSLGALLLEKDQAEEAVKEFDTALTLDPTMANAWYGRSVAEIGLQRWKPARDSLQQMFALGQRTDRRLGKMLQEARDSFRRVTNIIGNDRAAESLDAASDLASRLGETTGQPVTVRETKIEGFLPSRSFPAWLTGKDHHLVEIDERLPAEMVKHHLACRECSRMLIAVETWGAQQGRDIGFTGACRSAILNALDADIRRIATRKGYDLAKLSEVALGVAESAVIQIRQVIQDIAIERRLMEIDALREAQFCTLLLQAHAAVAATIESPNREMIPPKLNTLRDTLAALSALLLDRIGKGATEYAIQFTKTGVLPLARRIETMVWEFPAAEAEHNSGHDLNRHFDEIANLLGIRDWYEWNDESESNTPEPH